MDQEDSVQAVVILDKDAHRTSKDPKPWWKMAPLKPEDRQYCATIERVEFYATGKIHKHDCGENHTAFHSPEYGEPTVWHWIVDQGWEAFDG